MCQLLTDRLLHAGLTVACIDVDDVAAMVHAPGGRTEEHWDQAHRAHGSLVGRWLNEPVDAVLAHGPIYTRQETDALMAAVPPETGVLRVLLLASLTCALQRVHGEPDRGLYRDPDFLRVIYDKFWSFRPTIDPCDLTFDTETESADRISSVIADRLLKPTGA